jgi:radical SAM superfamily enzyme YgiQ (UPF0313 family)
VQPSPLPTVAGQRGGEAASPPLRAVLISTYELGHQPFGLASPAAWLRDAGVDVTCMDLAVQPLQEPPLVTADIVAFYVPMHTATRIAAQVIPRVRAINPRAHLCVYGLYAPMNEGFLRSLGADTIIGGEFEEPLVTLAQQVRELRGRGSGGERQNLPLVSLSRQRFKVPDRTGLPPLSEYACLQLPGGGHKVCGYVEATRGCKHLCRHCPIVPVYGGRFRVVQREVVLEDISRQVEVGAEHITFGDPDFFNGPAHAVSVVEALHRRFPDVSYDVTIKIEHLLQQARYLPALHDTGCLLVTSAVEAFDERILEIFDKRHSRQDFIDVVGLLRNAGLSFNPTFVAFTPWTTFDMYVDFLVTIHRLGLVGNVAPIQYAIRLLIPEGSRLLELPEVHSFLEGFDAAALCYRWAHPDPHVDELQRRILKLVEKSLSERSPREEVFCRVCELTAEDATSKQRVRLLELDHGPPRERIPYLTEPWFC